MAGTTDISHGGRKASKEISDSTSRSNEAARPITENVMGLKQCDLWYALRRFANPDIALIAKVLHRDGAISLGELRAETNLSTNILNHDLTEMRNAELVKKVGRKYCITHYGALLLEAIEEIKSEISGAPSDILFQPIAPKQSINEALANQS